MILSLVKCGPQEDHKGTNVNDLSIPPNRLATWDPGVRGGIPDVPNRVNVLDFGARGDGTTDDTAALKAAISACPTPGAVYLPAGSYVIKGPIDMPSGVVIRGEGLQKTHILATPGVEGKHTFKVYGSKGNYVYLTETAPEGTTQISVADMSPFTVGQTVELSMDNEDFMINVCETVTRGQIVKIVSIFGNTLTLDVPLRLEYPLSTNPRVRPLTPKQDVGFEDFHIKHVSSDDDKSTIFNFNYAVNCWVKNVESERSARHHINLLHSRHCTIRDSVIHHSYNYGGGGQGYGIVTEGGHTSDCLITNNTLYSLRHALLPNFACSGNVWSYNFSADDRGHADADLHGNYTNNDLFEGNVVQWWKVGGYWGPSGPKNTLFRNRAMKTYLDPSDRELTGIKIDHPSHDQNIIGNTLFGGPLYNRGFVPGPLPDAYAHNLWIEKNLICRDGIIGHDLDQSTIIDNILSCDQAAPWTLPDSLYLSDKPDFWGDLPWPAVGADIDLQRMAAGLPLHKIPAQIRYEQIMGLVPPESSSEIIIDNTDAGFSTSHSQDTWQEYTQVGG